MDLKLAAPVTLVCAAPTHHAGTLAALRDTDSCDAHGENTKLHLRRPQVPSGEPRDTRVPSLPSYDYAMCFCPILVPCKQLRNYATSAFAERFVHVKGDCIMYTGTGGSVSRRADRPTQLTLHYQVTPRSPAASTCRCLPAPCSLPSL